MSWITLQGRKDQESNNNQIDTRIEDNGSGLAISIDARVLHVTTVNISCKFTEQFNGKMVLDMVHTERTTKDKAVGIQAGENTSYTRHASNHLLTKWKI